MGERDRRIDPVGCDQQQLDPLRGDLKTMETDGGKVGDLRRDPLRQPAPQRREQHAARVAMDQGWQPRGDSQAQQAALHPRRCGERVKPESRRRWYRRRCTMYDVRFTIYDLRWTIYDGRCAMDDGRWTMDDGRFTMDDL